MESKEQETKERRKIIMDENEYKTKVLETLGNIEVLLGKLVETKKISTPKSAPKTASSSPKNDFEVRKGSVACLVQKQGAKGSFLIFKIFDQVKNEEVSCKCFKADIVSILEEGVEYELKGYMSEWKGYVDFVVDEIVSGGNVSTSTASNKEELEDDDVPF